MFWAQHISPVEIQENFGTLDYVWFVDEDLDLDSFCLERFIDVAAMLDVGLAQPGISAPCPSCRGSDYEALEQRSVSNTSVVARITGFVEIMAPLIKMDVWRKVHETIEMFIGVHKLFSITNWCPDFWWCGLAQQMVKQNASSFKTPCAVVFATPIIHFDSKTMVKDEEFYESSFFFS